MRQKIANGICVVFVCVALCLSAYMNMENGQLKAMNAKLESENKVLSSAYKMKIQQLQDLQK